MANAFRFEELDGPIGLVTFDLSDKKVNTLSRDNLMELASLVEQLEARTELKGLLFKSGKPGQFIAGADLNDIAALSFITPDQAGQLLGFGQQLFSRISRLAFPTVALIDGNCMGGGTELVLSMDDRILSSAAHTQVALPEVKIGVIPGWGGTQRLPRLIGLNAAIEMIGSGEGISAQKAVSVGFAFDAVPAEKLVAEGIRLIHHLRESGDWTINRERRRQPLGLDQDELGFAFAVAEGFLKGKTKGQYPAPLVALEAIKQGCTRTLEEGLIVEQKAVRQLVGSPILANLIAIFFMKNRLARDTGIGDTTVRPRAVNHVGVIGAGLMGAGIVAAHARSSIPTALVDVDDSRLKEGMARAQDVVLSRIKIGRAQPMDLANMLSLISTSTNPTILADCNVVIEAVTENPTVKKEVYAQLVKVLKDDAILASNTSTISITRMAGNLPHPDRFVGMHFFNPVDRMELVEVIRGEKTSDETVATVVALAKRIKKTPIVVNDCAGFLVNRVLFPYMNESLVLLQQGVPARTIDRVATRFGMPMGPITLTDLVGLETAVYAGKLLAHAYPDRTVTSPILEEMLKAGGGGKSALKFYDLKGKSAKAEPNPVVDEVVAKHQSAGTPPTDEAEIAARLFLPMLLEATRVLEEGIVREPGDVDMGLILGIGFPPFKGGILRWADTEGPRAIIDRLEKYAHLGKRYEPTESLLKLAQTGGSFYPRPKTVAPALVPVAASV